MTTLDLKVHQNVYQLSGWLSGVQRLRCLVLVHLKVVHNFQLWIWYRLLHHRFMQHGYSVAYFVISGHVRINVCALDLQTIF